MNFASLNSSPNRLLALGTPCPPVPAARTPTPALRGWAASRPPFAVLATAWGEITSYLRRGTTMAPWWYHHGTVSAPPEYRQATGTAGMPAPSLLPYAPSPNGDAA